MAVFDGRLFCGVLPSGHVHSLEAGKTVTYDRQLRAGWRHLAAVRANDKLQLYVDGKLVNESATFNSSEWKLQPDQPLRIGFGQHDYFNGRMKDVRIYERALSAEQIGKIHRTSRKR